MNDKSDETLLDVLREREKILEREYIEANADADRMVAVANARLTEVRELIEKLTTKRRGRPPKEAQATTPFAVPEDATEAA